MSEIKQLLAELDELSPEQKEIVKGYLRKRGRPEGLAKDFVSAEKVFILSAASEAVTIIQRHNPKVAEMLRPLWVYRAKPGMLHLVAGPEGSEAWPAKRQRKPKASDPQGKGARVPKKDVPKDEDVPKDVPF